MRDRFFRPACFALLCAACASTNVDPCADNDRARTLIRESTGQPEVFDPQAPLLSQEQIDAVLAGGLGLDEALRLALLNSRRLQAGFSEIGVARADFVQAGLLQNPSLGLGFLIPARGGAPKITADLARSLIDRWQLPARQQVAQSELEQRILEVSRFAGELVVETKQAYLESVAARDRLAAARENVGVAQAAFDAVRHRVEGGVATALEQSLAQSQALTAELALRSAERESFGSRRRLAALLSLDGDLMSVELTDALPGPGAGEPDREALVARARSTRLDLRAAEAAVAVAESQVALEHRRAYPDVEVGLFFEKPERGDWDDHVFGPGANVELPIFDDNGAQVRRAEFRRDQLKREYEALAAEISQDVRATVDRASSAARAARFVTDELLPQAERSFELARTSYDLGDTTLLALLESQRAVLQARSTRIEALLEAARTRVDLERAAGASVEVLGK